MAADIASFPIRPKSQDGTQRLPIRLATKKRTAPNAKWHVLPNGRIVVLDHDAFIANMKASVGVQAQ